MSEFLTDWKAKVKALKRETYTLYFAYRHERTPFYAKILAICVVGYAFSPIDLIPDFIPVLGLLDDLILIPLGIALVVRMIPKDVMDECRQKAEIEMASGKPTNWYAATVIIIIWISLAAFSIFFIWRQFAK